MSAWRWAGCRGWRWIAPAWRWWRRWPWSRPAPCRWRPSAPAIDFPTLAILFGLMFVSAQFQVGGAYDWCAARLAGAAAGPGALLALVVAVGGVLSALLTNDVVVFAMTPMLCAGLLARGLDPKPYLIALAGAANAGSAATLIGNPQNIVIGEVGHLHFGDFILAVCAPPASSPWASSSSRADRLCPQQLTSAPRASHGAGAGIRPCASPSKRGIATVLLVVLYLTGAPRDLSTLAVAALLLLSRRVAHPPRVGRGGLGA
jgi:Na+/H+ antiporter NhaD/arsenite permease-like protein